MGMTVSTTNRMPSAQRAVRGAATDLVNLAAETAAHEAKFLVATAIGGGRQYDSLPNRSSAPFQHPVKQSGGVVDSIHVERHPSIPAADMHTEDPNAIRMETGTPRMEPRPFLTEASYAGVKVLEKAAPVVQAKLGRI